MNAQVKKCRVIAALAPAVLVACSGAPPTTAVGPSALARLSTSVAAGWAAPARPDRRRSWISPKVSGKSTVLFVSDTGTDDVYMYEVPSLKLVGTITGFQQPQGECSDAKGDVWITDANAQTIYEVSHQGRLEQKLADSKGYPVGCAWNTNGDLAVMNIFGTDGAHGEVLVYPHHSKRPITYVNTQQYYYDFGGYDASGNLFFDGRSESGAFMLSELPSGAKSAQTIAINQRLYFPGMVQMSTASGNLLVGDQECGGSSRACVYQMTISGSTATVAGTVKLESATGSAVCDLVQGVEANGRIAGSDWEFCGYTKTSADLWPFPGGGKPSTENESTDTTPVGAALSTGG